MSRLIKILLLTLILAAVVVLPVSATEQYIENRSTDLFSYIDGKWNAPNQLGIGITPNVLSTGIYYELKHQTILLEEQNKLIAEQNALLSNQSLVGHKITCTGGTPVVCNEWTIEGT